MAVLSPNYPLFHSLSATLSPFLSSVQAKASGKKLQKVTLKVSPRGIILYDSASDQLMENISIYRLVVPFHFLIYASPMTMSLAEYCPRLVSSP